MFTMLLSLLVSAAVGANTPVPPQTSGLLVIISLDQVPYQYLVRFHDHFGSGGFRLLLDHGANFANTSFKHANNVTGPGHAALLSGAYGNQNGIIANRWYDRASRRTVYCVSDPRVRIVGGSGQGRSPANFIGSTLGDELRLQTGFHAKVISISNKDRAAILMGGKLANSAFWMADSLFVSSSYYVEDLPQWVKEFNASGMINSYFGTTWKKSLPDQAFALLDQDDVQYEADEHGLGRAFPHRITGNDTTNITSSYYSALLTSPYGAEIVSALAKKAILNEDLGHRGVMDMLCLSISSTDYVGHTFGPHSHEILEMMVQIDRVLADLFAFLDTEIGLDNCVLALSSDHAVAPIPEYIHANRKTADAKRVALDTLATECNNELTRKYGALPKGSSWIERIVEKNIYLNRETIGARGLAVESVAASLSAMLLRHSGIAAAVTGEQVRSPASPVESRLQRSFHGQRSGDVVFALNPYFLEGHGNSGTSHGEPYDYSAHVPLILVGRGIKAGTYWSEASPIDLAPTLSALLGIEFPAGREGHVMTEALLEP